MVSVTWVGLGQYGESSESGLLPGFHVGAGAQELELSAAFPETLAESWIKSETCGT